MNHDALIERAVRWLRYEIRCTVILSEITAYTKHGEIPDVIGWLGGKSILVEAKTTLKDFRDDKRRKIFRKNGQGIGHYRFYLTPPGIIPEKEISYGWGLYEVREKKVKHVCGINYANAAKPPFNTCLKSEVALLTSAIRRMNTKNPKGIKVKFY